MKNIKFFITAKMRFDYSPLKLEKGDKVKIAAVNETTAMVAQKSNPNEFDKFYIRISQGLTESITMSYVELNPEHQWTYID